MIFIKHDNVKQLLEMAELFKARIESCQFRESMKLFAIAEPVFSDNGQVQHVDGLVKVDISR